MTAVRAIASPAARSRTCRALIDRLPDWFGIPEANDHYVEGVAALDAFGAFDPDDNCVGLVALRRHHDATLEIWWMGVDPDWHRRGVGRALVARVEEMARAEGRSRIVAASLGPQDDDPGYAATRRFYEGMGFVLLCPASHADDDDNPLVWMLRDVPRP